VGEGKRGKPHSEVERLEIFAALAEDYFRMVELFSGGHGPGCSLDPERRHWVELFRAALLRKFIVRDEHVSLKLVVRALRACNYTADSRLAAGADEVAALFTAEMLQGRTHQDQDQETDPRPDPDPRPEPARARAADPAPVPADGQDRFEDVLYGRLLHGDADRFHRSRWAKDIERASAAAATRFEAEEALGRALDVVRYGFANDLLRAPVGPRPGASKVDG
jgi:hypothetical protein